jgi:hypothetical protein
MAAASASKMQPIRDRSWRRAMADRKLRRVLSWMRVRYICSWYVSYKANLQYYRRINIEDRELIQVETVDDYRQYVRHRARLARDHPQRCSCDMCGNHRRNYFGKNQLTIQELIFLEKWQWQCDE